MIKAAIWTKVQSLVLIEEEEYRRIANVIRLKAMMHKNCSIVDLTAAAD